jgi:large subunit ribosomal protein L11
VTATKSKLKGAGNTAGPRAREAREVGKGNVKTATGNAALSCVGEVSLKHVYEIAKIKQSEPRLAALALEGLVKSVVWQAGSMGILVRP